MRQAPLFLTYSNGSEDSLALVRKLEMEIRGLKAGDFYHLRVKGPGDGTDFFVEANGLLYPFIANALCDQRPIVVLDCDNGVVEKIDALFKMDFDVAAVFRYAQMQESGRQDYCSGFVALNHKRPAAIKKFWFEWIYRTAFYRQGVTEGFPSALKEEGWREAWFTDQGALNEILLPDGNFRTPEYDEYKIIPGNAYVAHGYKVLPLDRRIYGALPGDSKDARVIHYKGKAKEKRLG